jgi:hypothetical protein
MSTYEGFSKFPFSAFDKGTLSCVDVLHWTFTVLLISCGLLYGACPLVTTGPTGWDTSDESLDVSETGTLGHASCHM